MRRQKGGSVDQMTLKIDKHDSNLNPHRNSTWTVSQESTPVRGVIIAVSQLIKMLLILSNVGRICTHILNLAS